MFAVTIRKESQDAPYFHFITTNIIVYFKCGKIHIAVVSKVIIAMEDFGTTTSKASFRENEPHITVTLIEFFTR